MVDMAMVFVLLPHYIAKLMASFCFILHYSYSKFLMFIPILLYSYLATIYGVSELKCISYRASIFFQTAGMLSEPLSFSMLCTVYQLLP